MTTPKNIIVAFLAFFLPAATFSQTTRQDIHLSLNISGGSAAYVTLLRNDSSYGRTLLRLPLAQKDTVIEKEIQHTSAPVMLVNQNQQITYYTLFPGESIEVYIKGDLFTVKAKNDESRTAELAFSAALRADGQDLDLLSNKITKELFSKGDTYTLPFDRAIRKAYHEQVSFLEAYIMAHPVSRRFETYTRQILYYNFIENLLTPVYNTRYAGKPLPDGYVDSMLALKTILNDTALLQNSFGRPTLEFYNMFLCREKTEGLTADSLNGVLYQSALAHFEKPLADYLTYNIMRKAARESREWFLTQSATFARDCDNPVFTSIIGHLRADFAGEAQLDPRAFNLLDSEGRAFTLNDLLKAAGDSVVYIDFWASWCGPCVAEMPKSEKLSEAFAAKKIRFVYLSIDATKKDWLQGMTTQKHLNAANSFLVVNGPNSALSKYLRLETIPRYVIYKNSQLLASNAPRPSDARVKRTLEKWLAK